VQLPFNLAMTESSTACNQSACACTSHGMEAPPARLDITADPPALIAAVNCQVQPESPKFGRRSVRAEKLSDGCAQFGAIIAWNYDRSGRDLSREHVKANARLVAWLRHG